MVNHVSEVGYYETNGSCDDYPHYYEIVLTCNDALCQGDQLGWDVRYAAVFTLQVHQVMLCGLSAGQETLN